MGWKRISKHRAFQKEVSLLRKRSRDNEGTASAAGWPPDRPERWGWGHVQSAVLAAIRRLASTVSVIGSLWSERQLFGWPSADQAFYKLLLWISDRSIASRLANSYLQSGCISVRMNWCTFRCERGWVTSTSQQAGLSKPSYLLENSASICAADRWGIQWWQVSVLVRP